MEDFEPLDRPKTKVQWLLGNSCNYSCQYCHDIFRKGDKAFPDMETIVDVCVEIISHYDELGNDVVFEFIGGEPTLAGDVQEIGRRINNYPVSLVLKTNASADLSYWRACRQYLTDVVISVHKEFCDIDHIESVVDLLLNESLGKPVNVQILIPTTQIKQHFDWAIATRNRFRKKYNLGDYQMLFSNFGMGSDMYLPYNNEQWAEYYRTIGRPPPVPKTMSQDPIVHRNSLEHQKSINPGGNDSATYLDAISGQKTLKKGHPLEFKGFTCYAGIDTLVIDNNGDMWRGWCNQGELVGSIHERPFVLPKDPIVCAKDMCKNGFDQLARKEITRRP